MTGSCVFFLEHIYEEYGYDLAFDKGALHTLRKTAEDCKIKLSTDLSADISLPLYVEEEEEEFVFTYTLTRPHLEELTIDLIKKTIETTLLILSELSYTPKDLDEVLLVGGQSLMPRIHMELQKTLGYAPSKNVHPKEVVAKGAALMAKSLTQKESPDLTLQDRLPLTIGVRKSNGTIAPLFEHGTLLPAKVQRLLPTVRDMQTSIVLHLYQGNDPLAQNNDSIQVFIFSNLRPAPKGQTKVETVFTLDEGGLLSVQAKDKATRKRVRIQALSVAQFESLRHTAKEAPPISKKKEPSPKQPNVVDQALMIAKPFPNPLPNHTTPKKEATSAPPKVHESIAETKPQAKPKPQNVNPSHPKKQKPIKPPKKNSVPPTSSFFTRCIRWILSFIGRS